MKLLFLTIIVGLGSFLAGYFLFTLALNEIYSLPAQVSDATLPKSRYLEQVSEQPAITLMLVGDIMLDRGVKYMVDKYGVGYYKFPFLKITSYLDEADILFGNLESIISDKGVRVGSIYSFRADPKAVEGLIYAGFDVVSVANNHSLDYTREGLEDSIMRLKENGIAILGAGYSQKEAYGVLIKELDGIKIGFLAYTNSGVPVFAATEERSGVAWVDWNNLEEILEDIRLAKAKTDVLVVSLHAGIEYEKMPTEPFQIEFAKAAIDAGADMVIGHHHHVVQPIEQYKQGWIFYSLGNFVFDQCFSEETMEGKIVKVLLDNGKIKDVIPVDIKINDYFQPEIKL